jgi:hypothetical protein
MTDERHGEQADGAMTASLSPDDVDLDAIRRQGRLSVRTVNALALGRIYTVGALRAAYPSLRRLRSVGASTLRDVDRLLDQLTPPTATSDARAPYVLGRFEDDFMAAARATLSPRVAWILMRRWRLDGGDPATLAALGAHLGISAERVRQLQGEGLERARSLTAEASRAVPNGEPVRCWGAVAEHLRLHRSTASPSDDAPPRSPAAEPHDERSASVVELMGMLDR